MTHGIQSQSENAEPAWVEDVLHFWFEELSEADWFTSNDAIDGRIRGRFLSLHERLVENNGAGTATPR